jgi:hypothetical protein
MAAGHATATATSEPLSSSSGVADNANTVNKAGSLLVYSAAALARLTAQLEPARDAFTGCVWAALALQTSASTLPTRCVGPSTT